MREPMQKVRRAVERIDEEGESAGGRRHFRGEFLADNDRAGKLLLDDGQDVLLGASVHIADEVRRSLVLPDERSRSGRGTADDFARAQRGFLHGARKAGQLSCVEGRGQCWFLEWVVGREAVSTWCVPLS